MRLDNWQTNLSDLIRKREKEPFNIVNFNCLMWALEAVQAVKGDDYYSIFSGKFKTEKGAAKALRTLGKSASSAAYLDKMLGVKIPLVFAKKGDIIVADVEQTDLAPPQDQRLFGPAVGVCYGSLSYFVGTDGLVTYETLRLGTGSYGLSC